MDRLYELLPAIYRQRDFYEGEPLRALMAVLEGELQALEADIDGLYRNWFIETCDEWVVAYIGDLLGVRGLQSSTEGTFSLRAYVANTLAYRRRKGTALMLEQLARDTTGWNAHAVEFFDRLVTSQQYNHIRLHSHQTVDLRQAYRVDHINTAFDDTAHTVDVRRIIHRAGKHNIPNIGLFLWRLQSYVLMRSQARAVSDGNDRFTFSTLGCDAPLFNRPQAELDITHFSEEFNVPGRLRRRALYDELQAYREALSSNIDPPQLNYFGTQSVLEVFLDGANDPVPLENIFIENLSNWDNLSTNSNESEVSIAVDPVLGRLALLTGAATSVEVSYAYGFSGDIGGGPYNRRQTLAVTDDETWARTISRLDETDYTNLSDAISAWQDEAPARATLTITDSHIYEEFINISLSDNQQLIIQAQNRNRPTICLLDESETHLGLLQVDGADGTTASLTLNGLLIEGGVYIASGSLGQLDIVHSTLVPGRAACQDGSPRHPELASLIVAPDNIDLSVCIAHSIVGSLSMPESMAELDIRDSVVDSPGRDGQAVYQPVLVSGDLSAFSGLANLAVLNVAIGNEGPYLIEWEYTESTSTPPQTPQENVAGQLQTAIRAIPTTSTAFAERHAALDETDSELEAATQAFENAQVIVADNRLIVIAGNRQIVEIQAVEGDSTAADLGFVADDARQVYALLSGPLSSAPTLSANDPTLNVTMGIDGPHAVELNANTATTLQADIREAQSTAAFADTIVTEFDGRWMLIPGAEVEVVLGQPAADRTTLIELAFDVRRPAIAPSVAASEDAEHLCGPPISLERATLFGQVFVRELHASETIFSSLLHAQRQQAGCVRYSYVPPHSRTPRRFNCQPDLALTQLARERELESAALLSEAERTQLLRRLQPAFTSMRYGHPNYAQLDVRCPEEIVTGAEDSSEMGVFSHLEQPKREANLRAALRDYLRFGLEAGIFYVT